MDYLKSNNEGTEYIIQEDLFKINSDEIDLEIENPKYEKQELSEVLTKVLGENLLNEYKEKAGYTILTSDSEKTGCSIYMMDNEVWLAYYVDNTADKSEIIMSIYKIEKQI